MESRTATTASSATTRTKKTLVITCGDSYLGHCIAAYLLRESERNGRDRHSECRIRVLCRREKNCDDLRDMGAEIVEIDYDDRRALRRAFRDCECAIFIPDMTHNRVRHGERIIEAMEKENLRHVLMMSTIGAASNDRKLRNLCEFRELERCLQDSFTRGRWCIFRLEFLYQYFLLWAPAVEDERVLKMSTGHDGRFAPVNLRDVCRATYIALTRHRRNGDNDRDGHRALEAQPQPQSQAQSTPEGFRWIPMDERHHRRVYCLTGSDAVSGEELARILGDAIGEREIRFENVSRSEMRRELERWRDEDGKRGRRDGPQEGLLAQVAGAVAQAVGAGRGDERRDDDRRDGDRKDRDGRHRASLRRHLTETKIETMLDFFEYVKSGGADFTSDDLADIIGEKPESLEKFFREHRDEFRGDGDRRGRDEDKRQK